MTKTAKNRPPNLSQLDVIMNAGSSSRDGKDEKITHNEAAIGSTNAPGNRPEGEPDMKSAAAKPQASGVPAGNEKSRQGNESVDRNARLGKNEHAADEDVRASAVTVPDGTKHQEAAALNTTKQHDQRDTHLNRNTPPLSIPSQPAEDPVTGVNDQSPVGGGGNGGGMTVGMLATSETGVGDQRNMSFDSRDPATMSQVLSGLDMPPSYGMQMSEEDRAALDENMRAAAEHQGHMQAAQYTNQPVETASTGLGTPYGGGMPFNNLGGMNWAGNGQYQGHFPGAPGAPYDFPMQSTTSWPGMQHQFGSTQNVGYFGRNSAGGSYHSMEGSYNGPPVSSMDMLTPQMQIQLLLEQQSRRLDQQLEEMKQGMDQRAREQANTSTEAMCATPPPPTRNGDGGGKGNGDDGYDVGNEGVDHGDATSTLTTITDSESNDTHRNDGSGGGGGDGGGGDGGGGGGGGGSSGGDDESDLGADKKKPGRPGLRLLKPKKKTEPKFDKATHPMTRKDSKMKADFMKAVAKEFPSGDPDIQKLAKLLVDGDKMMNPETYSQLIKVLEKIVCKSAWVHTSEFTMETLLGLKPMSLVIFVSGMFKFDDIFADHLREVHGVFMANYKKLEQMSLLKRFVEDTYDSAEYSIAIHNEYTDLARYNGLEKDEFTFENVLAEDSPEGPTRLREFFEIRYNVQKRLSHALKYLYEEMNEIKPLNATDSTTQGKLVRNLQCMGNEIKDTDQDPRYIRDMLDLAFQTSDGKRFDMLGLKILRELINTTSTTTIGDAVAAFGDMCTFVNDGFDYEMSLAGMVEVSKLNRDTLIGKNGHGFVTDYISSLSMVALLEKMVRMRKGEWDTVGKACLDAVKAHLMHFDRLRRQEEVSKTVWMDLVGVLEKTVEDQHELKLLATKAYEDRRKNGDNGSTSKRKAKKNGKAGAASANGARSGAEHRVNGPKNPDDAAKLKHPDRTVYGDAMDLLKEKKSNGAPKLTIDQARRKFKNIKFFANLFERDDDGKLKYDKLSWSKWKDIDTERVANYNAEEYACFRLVTDLPPDVFKARQLMSTAYAAGAQGQPPAAAPPAAAPAPAAAPTPSAPSKAPPKVAKKSSASDERKKAELYKQRAELQAQLAATTEELEKAESTGDGDVTDGDEGYGPDK